MGSHPTLDQTELAAEARQLRPSDWQHGHAIAHQLDDRDSIHDHTHPAREVEAERAFDRLNPDFGVPADRTDRIGHHDLAQREAALALGVRVAVHDSRQNDSVPIIWQPGQDYRMADALQRARAQPTRTRWGSERLGPER